MAENKELVAKEKQEVAGPAEQTRTGRIFTPDVDICETEREIVVFADMPGVTAENLDIDLEDNLLTLRGRVRPQAAAGETLALQEYNVGDFVRQFALSNVVDQDKIQAKLLNGVMELVLPKVEKAQPRKIAVTAG